MVKRSLAITSAAHLSIKNRQVVLSQDKKVLNTAPLEDLAIIVVDSSDSTWSSSLLAECGNHGIAVVVCGEKHGNNILHARNTRECYNSMWATALRGVKKCK